MGDVVAGHVAGDDDDAGIVRADGGVEHGAAAAGSDDAPAGVLGSGEGEGDGEDEKERLT